MAYLFNIVYLLVLLLAAPWLIDQSLRKGKYRAGFAQKFLGRVPVRQGDRPCIWFHAVSVGEVNLLAVLLKQHRERHPGWDCVLSTTTATGYALAQQKYPELTVFYAPLDFSWAVKTALRRIRPAVLVLAELELWPNLIRAAKQSGSKVAIVNGRLSERSFRGYRRMRWLVGPLLNQVDCIAVQNQEYAGRFLSLGANPTRVHVTGSLKFDGAQTDRNNPATMRLGALVNLHDDDLVFLAGSTQAPEEAIAIETFRTLSVEHPRLRLVIVPRHPHRFEEVAELLARSGLEWSRRSELREGSGIRGQGSATGERDLELEAGGRTLEEGKFGNRKSEIGNDSVVFTPHSTLRTPHLPASSPQPPTPSLKPQASHPAPRSPIPDPRSPPSILLIDTVGELGAWWGTASIGFVGGSLSTRGGQNMIEPAALGVAVSFGPNTQNFRDVVQLLLARDAAVVVRDQAQLTSFVRRSLECPQFAAEMAQRGIALVNEQRGATERTWTQLEPLLRAESMTSSARAA